MYGYLWYNNQKEQDETRQYFKMANGAAAARAAAAKGPERTIHSNKTKRK